MMWRTICLALAVGTLLGAGPCFGLGDIYLRTSEGDVLLKNDETIDWVAAAANIPLADGDQLWVPQEGAATVQFREGVLRLGGNSMIELIRTDIRETRFFLAVGRTHYALRGLSGRSIAIETPDGPVEASQDAAFQVDVSEAAGTTVSVLQGAVQLHRSGGSMVVSAGRRVVLGPNDPQPRLFALGPPDAWESWNRQQDAVFFRGSEGLSRRYLPEELGPYADDLDRGGRWVQTAEYGYVWTPTVVAKDQWAPYRMGRWVWIHGNYVWVSQEPWGWVPHHYGRWVHLQRVGWCWVPPGRGAAFWAPGYVAWINTPTAISWVPLAPREIYYGRGHYGPHSFDIARVDIRASVGHTTYQNVRVQHAVTTIHRDSFLSGRPGPVVPAQNPFLRGAVPAGPPPIKPAHATMTPSLKQIPARSLPPSRLGSGGASQDKRGYQDYNPGRGAGGPGQLKSTDRKVPDPQDRTRPPSDTLRPNPSQGPAGTQGSPRDYRWSANTPRELPLPSTRAKPPEAATVKPAKVAQPLPGQANARAVPVRAVREPGKVPAGQTADVRSAATGAVRTEPRADRLSPENRLPPANRPVTRVNAGQEKRKQDTAREAPRPAGPSKPPAPGSSATRDHRPNKGF